MIENNHRRLEQKLKKRGWDKHYIRKTVQILRKSKANKTEGYIFWTYLVMFEICTLAVFTGTLPLLALLPNIYSIGTVTILGLCLGFFSEYIYRHFDFGSRHFSVLLGLHTLNIAFYLLLFGYAKKMLGAYGLYITANPLAIIAFYTIGYIIPHILSHTGVRR